MPSSLLRIWTMSALLDTYVGKETLVEMMLQLRANERRPLHGIPILIKVTALCTILRKHKLNGLG